MRKNSNLETFGNKYEMQAYAFGISKIRYYNYRCLDCGYASKIQECLLDRLPGSIRSKQGKPEFQCICGGKLRYVDDLETW